VRLSRRTSLIGSGEKGFSLSHPLDCHVYLLDGGSELAIVDAGGGGAPERLVAEIERDGLDPGRVRHLILTHGHYDHAGGAAALHELLPRATVYASAAIARAIGEGDDAAISLDVAVERGLYPPGATLRACPVDVALREGDAIAVGDVSLGVLETPGHSDGHVSLLLDDGGERALFSGDVVFAGGSILLQPIHDCRIDAHVESLRKLRDLQLTSLFPGHFAVCLHDGQLHVELANGYLDRLTLPPQAIRP
jgi:glyoxylase-like metal-dependent hydrolase (beta-lactamase superfamily II)